VTGPLDFDGPDDPAARLAQLDDPPPPAPRSPVHGGRYGWLLGIVAVLVVGFVVVNGARTSGPGARGLAPGAQLPPFAAPLLGASCEQPRDPCDANVATRTGQGSAGSRPACEVRGAQILNLCELTARGPVVLAFLATRGGDCANELDRLGRVAARHPGVQVAAVGIRGDLAQLRAIARSHGWRFPVGWDRDGILANLYGVAVCPHITYARWHGRVQSTSLGAVGERELDRRVEAAVAASARAGWAPPR
jgi:peroxiredoxin